MLEKLEDRTLLSTIIGRVVEDLAGDGITQDDPALAGWTVELTGQQESTLLQADFSDGAGGTSLDGFTASGLWHATSACSGTGAGRSTLEAAFFGVDATCAIDSGAAAGDLNSPLIAVPTNGITGLEFLYRLGNADGTLAGNASLQISVDGGAFATLASNSDGNLAVSNGWSSYWINLSDYAGQTIVVRFLFEPSTQASASDFGWQLDDLKVNYQYAIEAETDALGNYSLSNIGVGTFNLAAFGSYGWRETVAIASTVTVTDNTQTFTGIDFGEFDMGRIPGQVFYDENENGIKDPVEIGIPNWAIVLNDGSGQLVQTVFTDNIDLDGDGIVDPYTETGIFGFAGLAPGSYSLVVQVEPEWTEPAGTSVLLSISGTSSGETLPAVPRPVFPGPGPCVPSAIRRCPPPASPPFSPPPPPPEICGDGIDNDFDGYTDENCPTPPPPPPPEICGDGIDNDFDGHTDENCPIPPPPPPPPPPPEADLHLTKDDWPDPVIAGELLTYTITVHNHGPDMATGVVMTDTIPPDAQFESATASQGFCNNNGQGFGATVTCNLGTIANGSEATVTIQVRAWPPSGTIISNTASASGTETDPDPSNNSDTETTKVVDCFVQNVWWGQYINGTEVGHPLTDNPHPDFPGGYGFFPEKAAVTDPVPAGIRDLVNVWVQVTPAGAGRTVYLRSFDVDDPHPSTNFPEVDADEAGFDNRITPTHGVFLASGDYRATVTTESSGMKSTPFRVTVQPGNNFRIAASCVQSEVDKLDVIPGKAGRVPPFNGPVEGLPFDGALSDMLTIWRRLHVEVDSMTAVQVNTVTGKLKDYLNQLDTWIRIKTDVSLSDSPNRFENGKLTDKNGVVFDVISSELLNGKLILKVQKRTTSPYKPALGNFTLRDDDALKDGQDVPNPDTSTLAAAMSYAYVKAIVGLHAYNVTPEAPFILNVTDVEGAQKWDTVSLNANDFWVTYLLGAFQPKVENDNDPDSETAWAGETLSSRGGSLVYVETGRDWAVEDGWDPVTFQQNTVVHEVGHAVARSGEHPVTRGWDLHDYHLVRKPRGSNWVHPEASRYSNRYLHLIRSTEKPASR